MKEITKKAIPKVNINTDYMYMNNPNITAISLIFKKGISYEYTIDKFGKFIVFIGNDSWAFSELEFEGYFMNIKESRDEKLKQILNDNK